MDSNSSMIFGTGNRAMGNNRDTASEFGGPESTTNTQTSETNNDQTIQSV